MNSQDIQNLHEAYIGVYADLDEERAEGVKPYGGGKDVGDKMRAGHGIKAKEKPLSGEKGDGSGYGEDKKFAKPDDKIEKPGTTVPAPKKGGYGRISPVIPYGIGANSTKSRSANSRVRRLDPGAPTSQKLPPEDKKKPSKEIIRKKTNEEVDIYDIILSHLLDEGYADTYEAAEAIMVNMSEDWRESIVEEVLDERNRGEEGMSDREVSRRRNLGGNTRSKVSSSSLGDHGPQGAIQKFHNVKSKQRQAIHKTARGVRGDTGESGGKGRYEANKDHKDGYPSITKRGQGPS